MLTLYSLGPFSLILHQWPLECTVIMLTLYSTGPFFLFTICDHQSALCQPCVLQNLSPCLLSVISKVHSVDLVFSRTFLPIYCQWSRKYTIVTLYSPGPFSLSAVSDLKSTQWWPCILQDLSPYLQSVTSKVHNVDHVFSRTFVAIVRQWPLKCTVSLRPFCILQDLSPYLPSVIPGLKQCLLDPVPEVRSVSARALGAMVKGMGEGTFDDLLPWLMEKLVSEVSSVDRSGAAQGEKMWWIDSVMNNG